MQRVLSDSITVRFTPDQARKVRLVAMSYNLNVSQVVRKLLWPLFNLSEAQIMVSGIMQDMKKPGA